MPTKTNRLLQSVTITPEHTVEKKVAVFNFEVPNELNIRVRYALNGYGYGKGKTIESFLTSVQVGNGNSVHFPFKCTMESYCVVMWGEVFSHICSRLESFNYEEFDAHSKAEEIVDIITSWLKVEGIEHEGS